MAQLPSGDLTFGPAEGQDELVIESHEEQKYVVVRYVFRCLDYAGEQVEITLRKKQQLNQNGTINKTAVINYLKNQRDAWVTEQQTLPPDPMPAVATINSVVHTDLD